MENPSKRDKLGHFLPGTVGNPHGRPAVDMQAREWARQIADTKGRKLLEAVLDDKKAPLKDRLAVAFFLDDKAHGKATQRLEGQLEQGGKLEITIRRLDAIQGRSEAEGSGSKGGS